MSVIKDILIEEKERLEKLSSSYREKISSLPKGYISVKRINGNKYAYKNYREKDKVKSEYLGKPGSRKVHSIENAIKERRNYEKMLKHAKENLKEINKAVGKQ